MARRWHRTKNDRRSQTRSHDEEIADQPTPPHLGSLPAEQGKKILWLPDTIRSNCRWFFTTDRGTRLAPCAAQFDHSNNSSANEERRMTFGKCVWDGCTR